MLTKIETRPVGEWLFDPNKQVLDPQQFCAEFVRATSEARKRVWIQVMGWEYGEWTRKFEDALTQAKRSNYKLDVRMQADSISLRTAKSNIRPFARVTREEKRVLAANQKMHQREANAGVKVNFLNLHKHIYHAVTWAGRNHIKIYLVDNVAWIGGLNLQDMLFSAKEIMVRLTDKDLVAAIAKQYEQVNGRNPKKDYAVEGGNWEWLVDRGARRSSIIYDRAIEMVQGVRAGEEILVVSQVVPDGKLLNELERKSKEGYKVRIVTSAWYTHGVWGRQNIRDAQRRINDNFQVLLHEGKIHAKHLRIGDREVYFGSHNLTMQGVFIGTAECGVVLKGAETQAVKELKEWGEKILSEAKALPLVRSQISKIPFVGGFLDSLPNSRHKKTVEPS